MAASRFPATLDSVDAWLPNVNDARKLDLAHFG
jgi:hypothetical protein